MMEGYSQEYMHLRRAMLRAYETGDVQMLNELYEKIFFLDLSNDEIMSLMNLDADLRDNLDRI